jgi:hypothetical protein
MQPDALNEDFRDILDALSDHGVEFVVVGAWSLAFHGHPRATLDFDVFVRPSPDNARRVIAALRDFGAPLASHGVTEQDFAVAGTVYQIGLPPRRIDLITEISGVTFEVAWATRAEATIAGRTIAFLGRQALIDNKRASGRPKDLADVARLEAYAGP